MEYAVPNPVLGQHRGQIAGRLVIREKIPPRAKAEKQREEKKEKLDNVHVVQLPFVRGDVVPRIGSVMKTPPCEDVVRILEVDKKSELAAWLAV